MIDLFKIFGTIAIENDAANKALDETVDEAKSAESKISGNFKKMGKAAAKFAVAVGTAAATGGAVITKMAVSNYADYEQLVGGVDTLFKESSKKVQKYAAMAYKTAGLSANDYMETVTSFSASLLQGLGGDTKKAADIADMAIIDMADNANKMGTAMADIQNAYQGFAKQNYTMLDNLKLGYGGTQEEMIRLINDSGILEEKISSLDGVTFDQMIMAIHEVQTNIGITGTTAKEAEQTISGSIGSMKAAWSNLLTGLADGNQNVSKLFNEFYKSIKTVGKNLIPVVKTTVSNLISLVGQILTKDLPKLLKTGAEMLDNIANGIEKNMPAVTGKILDVLLNITGTIRKKAPDLIQSGINLIVNLAKGIMGSLPKLISKLPTIVSNIAGVINDNAPKLIPAALNLIKVLAVGLIKAIPALIVNIPKIIKAIVDVLTAFGWAKLGGSIIKKIGDGIKKSVGIVKTQANKIKDSFLKPMQTLQSKIKSIIDKIKGFFKFKVSVPHIPLPKFSISPSGWKLGDLIKGKIPKLGIAWHAEGGIFDKPTIFETAKGLHGVGEAGAEAITPISKLQEYVTAAVAEQNRALIDALREIEAGRLYAFNIATQVDGKQIAIATAKYTQSELNKLQIRSDRLQGVRV